MPRVLGNLLCLRHEGFGLVVIYIYFVIPPPQKLGENIPRAGLFVAIQLFEGGYLAFGHWARVGQNLCTSPPHHGDAQFGAKTKKIGQPLAENVFEEICH